MASGVNRTSMVASKDCLLSSQLRESTKEAHVMVEKHPSVDALITGLLPREVHVQYLMCLYYIYQTLEAQLAAHSSHPALCHVYNPSILSRSEKLGQDVCYFLDLPPGSNWQNEKQLYQNFGTSTKLALKAYMRRLNALGSPPLDVTHSIPYLYAPPACDPSLLLAHAYVRYLGDLSGGQIIKKCIAASYSLPLDSLDGQRYYHFGEESSIAEIKAFKKAFRNGMDTAGFQMNSAIRAAMLQEANHAFELNMKLFSSFAEGLDRTSHAIPIGQTASLPSEGSLSAISSTSNLSELSMSSDISLYEPVALSEKATLRSRRVMALLVLFAAILLGLNIGEKGLLLSLY